MSPPSVAIQSRRPVDASVASRDMEADAADTATASMDAGTPSDPDDLIDPGWIVFGGMGCFFAAAAAVMALS